nr:bacillithiol system redox-active protein YtxJ [Neobacillus sp. Marseille-Q6967]
MEKIESIEQFEDLLAKEEKFLFLKHSLTCPISHAAYQEYEKFSNENENVPAYYLAVQEARPLSNDIAEKFQIKHESPQVFLFSKGEPSWNASHWKITKKSLAEAVNENQ